MSMEQQQTSSDTTHVQHMGNADDAEYDAFLQRIQARFLDHVGGSGAPLFSTDADGLFAAYLEAFQPENRQYHNCHACRHFIERFGHVVTIDSSGATASPIWNEDDAPGAYKPSIRTMARLVRRAAVTGVFLSSDPVWGSPVTGIWHHLAVTPPSAMVFRKSALKTAGQAMAEKREDFKTVAHALAEFTPEHIAQAVTLLKTDALYRSEKVLGAAQWLADLHKARAESKGKAARDNVLWRAIATAPAGFCHPRSSMIGSLLEDIAAGKDFDDVARAFKAKMHPLQYQRPQAAPSAGNIAQAEKIVAALGIAPSLRRRFARIEDVDALWKPAVTKPASPATGGVFAHLTPKDKAPAKQMEQPTLTMTWEKFRKTVLPEAVAVELLAPSHGNYVALVTASDPASPPILQWDQPERRNPVSMYVWNGGSAASQWHLAGGSYAKVTAIALRPHAWYGNESRYTNQSTGVIFLLDGARESRFNGGLALFPETLKSELHGARATIEAFSRNGVLDGAEEASACGVIADKGSQRWSDIHLRVLDGSGARLRYSLDRWD